jgi:hypothetical protein
LVYQGDRNTDAQARARASHSEPRLNVWRLAEARTVVELVEGSELGVPQL